MQLGKVKTECGTSHRPARLGKDSERPASIVIHTSRTLAGSRQTVLSVIEENSFVKVILTSSTVEKISTPVNGDSHFINIIVVASCSKQRTSILTKLG